MAGPGPCPACGAERWGPPRPGGFRFLGVHYRRVRCRGCGLFGLDPLPAPELWPIMYAPEYFEAYSVHHSPLVGYAAGREVAERVAEDRLRRIAPFRPAGRLLEIGCAGGHFLAAARRHGYEVTGVEYSEAMAAHARQTYGLEVMQGDVLALDLRGPFDVVVMEDVLEHLRDPSPVLRKAGAVLADGGFLVIDGPLERQPNLSLALLELNLRLRTVEDPEMAPAHIWQFSLSTLRRLVEAAGFREERAWVYQEAVEVPPSADGAREARRRVARAVNRASAWISRRRLLCFLRHGDRALIVYRRSAA